MVTASGVGVCGPPPQPENGSVMQTKRAAIEDIRSTNLEGKLTMPRPITVYCWRISFLQYGDVSRSHAAREVAAALGINQPKVSALLHYKLEGFSVERLMRFLVALGQDVEIVVKAKPRSRSARIAVCAA